MTTGGEGTDVCLMGPAQITNEHKKTNRYRYSSCSSKYSTQKGRTRLVAKGEYPEFVKAETEWKRENHPGETRFSSSISCMSAAAWE